MPAATVHPGPSAYNKGCRCTECRALNQARHRRLRAERYRRVAEGDPGVPHGTGGGYRNWGCRCPECSRAHQLACALWKAQRKVAGGRRGQLSELEKEALNAWAEKDRKTPARRDTKSRGNPEGDPRA
jgi:hypothetical protein